jgi:hypothetical protein
MAMDDEGKELRPITLIHRSDKRPPPLSDEELIAIRRMLSEHALVVATCPLARKIINGDG